MNRFYTIDEVEFVMNDIHGNVAISSIAFRELTGLFHKWLDERISGRSIYRRKRLIFINLDRYEVILNKHLYDAIYDLDWKKTDEAIRLAFLNLDAIRLEFSQRVPSID